MRRSILIICLLLSPALLADEPLITDRPDQTESASIVPAGTVQLESGLLDADGSDNLAGASLFRIGLAQRLELRIGFDEWPLQGADRSVDSSIGAKLSFRENDGRKPAIALLASISQRVGGQPANSANKLRPTLRLALSNRLNDRFSLGYNVGIKTVSRLQIAGAPPPGQEHLLSRSFWTLSCGYSASEKVGLFVEAFGEQALSDDQPTESSLNGGLTWLLRPRIQLDLYVGGGLAEASADSFVGAGVSYRWPR
jgi:hypothetical protein